MWGFFGRQVMGPRQYPPAPTASSFSSYKSLTPSQNKYISEALLQLFLPQEQLQ
jgi:hypothetical protein